MALQPVISSFLIDFDDPNASSDEKAYQKQVYTAIKLNMNDLQNYDVIDKFTQCQKCSQVLTDKVNFSPLRTKTTFLTSKKFNPIQMILENNILKNSKKLDSPKSSGNADSAQEATSQTTRISDLPKTRQEQFKDKNVRVFSIKASQRKDPIILIVFDVSNSMEQLIEQSSSGKTSWQHIDKIKETKIYKKIVAEEQKQHEKLIKEQYPNGQVPKDSKIKYTDHLKKNKLLMGLTEYLVSKINPSKKGANAASTKKIFDFCNNDNQKNKNVDTKNKTIGFMFFNSNVMLNLDSQKSKKVVLIDTNSEIKSHPEGFDKEVVDFDAFDTLFKTGQKYGEKYTNKITNFDFDSLEFNSISNQTNGQTALGPAIVTALGIVSKHGQGSSIVVVTDGIGNKGIFDQTESWDEGYKLLKLRLEKLKCFMTVLEFRKMTDNSKMKEEEKMTGLDKFCQRHNESVVKKINVLMNQNQKSNYEYATSNLEEIEKKMKIGIDRDNCKFSNGAFLRCQHPNVKFEKSTDGLHNKLFNLKQTVHLIPEFKTNGLQPKDYLHHFMTQIVIKYEDTKTGEQCVFMSYIIQKIIKYSKMKPKDLKSLDNEHTFMNIIEYLHSEEQQLSLENIPLGIVRETFRKTLSRTAVAQRTFRFPNKQMSDDEFSYEWMQNMKKFEDQAYLNEQMKIDQQKLKKSKTVMQESEKETKGNLELKGETQRSEMRETENKQKIEQVKEAEEEEEDYEEEFISL